VGNWGSLSLGWVRWYRYIRLYGSWFISNCLRAGVPRGNATISV